MSGRADGVMGGLVVLKKSGPAMTARCGAKYESLSDLLFHESKCMTCIGIRDGSDLVSPLAMPNEVVVADGLLQYDAGVAEGIYVSRRFRVVSNSSDFWLLDSASSACVNVPDCDCVVNREVTISAELLVPVADSVSVPVDLFKRLVYWANQHDDRGPTGQGWQSPELEADIRSGEELLKDHGASKIRR